MRPSEQVMPGQPPGAAVSGSFPGGQRGGGVAQVLFDEEECFRLPYRLGLHSDAPKAQHEEEEDHYHHVLHFYHLIIYIILPP